MIIKAKGAILKNQKNDLLIDNFYFPNKLTYGQVLIKIAYSGICGSQIGEIDGVKGIDKFLPHLLGHEGSGVVIDVGDGVTNLKKNDHVVLHWKKNTRIESQNPNYLWKNKKLNAGKITTFNEYAIISENRITKINKNFNLKLASLFGCALTTGFGAVTNTAKVKLGQSIGIFGCGGVGISSVIAASLSGCNPIYTFDISDKKLSFSKKFGANKIINLKKNKKLNLILNLNLDIIIECTGIKENIEMAFKMLNDKGVLVLVGVMDHNKNMSINPLPLHFGKKIIGTHGGDGNPEIDIPRYIDLILSKKINLKALITDEYKLNQINKAIKKIKNNQCLGRTIISMS